jgi:hypothetical protein
MGTVIVIPARERPPAPEPRKTRAWTFRRRREELPSNVVALASWKRTRPLSSPWAPQPPQDGDAA